jgi:hypothetical protein
VSPSFGVDATVRGADPRLQHRIVLLRDLAQAG